MKNYASYGIIINTNLLNSFWIGMFCKKIYYAHITNSVCSIFLTVIELNWLAISRKTKIENTSETVSRQNFASCQLFATPILLPAQQHTVG